jgi:hypothetical protein
MRAAAFAVLSVACGGAETSSTSDGGLTDGVRVNGFGAVAIDDDIDRVLVTERDDEAGTCVSITLRRPLGVPRFDITTPLPWSVEQIGANDVPESCDHEDPSMFGGVTATSATGTIELYDISGTGWPCTIDLDFVVDFIPFLIEIPTTYPMMATGVAVNECP